MEIDFFDLLATHRGHSVQSIEDCCGKRSGFIQLPHMRIVGTDEIKISK